LWFCLEERGKDQFWKSPILYFSFLKVRASFLPSFPPSFEWNILENEKIILSS